MPEDTLPDALDIVKRLRAFNGRSDIGTRGEELLDAAADTIKRLRASERSAWNAAVVRDEEIERLREQLAAVRDQALEEAAKVAESACDDRSDDAMVWGTTAAAAAIRALKDKQGDLAAASSGIPACSEDE
jgi:hypothetical protein